MKYNLETDVPGLILELSDEPGPDFLTTRGLQKGLVSYHEGKCLVQEGMGFGAPIVSTTVDTYFSKKATLERRDDILVKRYQFDCVSRIEMGQKRLENPALRYGFEALVGLYMRMEPLQPLLLRLQRGMALSLEATCRFVDVPAIGTAEVIYAPSEKGMRVRADFDVGLEKPQFIMVNEQGANYFDRAVVDDRELADEDIKGWMAAGKAALRAERLGLEFSLDPPPCTRLFVGRESTEYLSWAGLDLHCDQGRVEYEIRLTGDEEPSQRNVAKVRTGAVTDG
jgi:hypothetical protein